MTLIVGNTRYRVDFSFSLTVTLMVLFCHDDTVLLCLVSSMLHETGHLAFMYIFHQPNNSIGNHSYNVNVYDDVNFDLHFHKNYEVIYVISGKAICSVN